MVAHKPAPALAMERSVKIHAAKEQQILRFDAWPISGQSPARRGTRLKRGVDGNALPPLNATKWRFRKISAFQIQNPRIVKTRPQFKGALVVRVGGTQMSGVDLMADYSLQPTSLRNIELLDPTL
ncbi:hypothetical protein E1B28_011644 [Marasmius oreades]|uniref:Uncharacterized protein n=1 Tax=Marasmius oreades TaxID=181124 RepID=A0A9P7RV45_9AGAR|nr:uncharacterized protein E1B28_011644 [Marasmius oreades]KAG7090023.1 hypothetical protein E1B28_011644 [Marasmius oreades]